MKSVITLTKTLTLALLVTVFVQASATTIKSDDTGKCKKACCKNNKSDVQVEQTMKELQAVMTELKTELASLNVADVKLNFSEAIAIAPIKLLKTGTRVIVIAGDEPKVCNKSTMDVQKMNKEMDQVQENMSQMDPTLKNDDEKTRKTAEEILLTGIKA